MENDDDDLADLKLAWQITERVREQLDGRPERIVSTLIMAVAHASVALDFTYEQISLSTSAMLMNYNHLKNCWKIDGDPMLRDKKCGE